MACPQLINTPVVYSLHEPQLVRSSTDRGWKDLTVRTYHEPAATEHWAPAESPDLNLIILDRGTMYMEQRRLNSAWRPHTVRPGDMFLRPPGRGPYELRWTSDTPEPAHTIHMCIHKEALLRISEEIGYDSGKIALAEQVGVHDSLLAQVSLHLGRMLRDEHATDALYVASATRLMVAHLLRHYASAPHLSTTDCHGLSRMHIRQIREYIAEHIAQPITLEALAQQTGYSPYYFTRLFRQTTELSPYQYVLQQRVARAQTLLAQSNASITEVAKSCGFANHSHLTRVFHQVVGTTPSQYRRAYAHSATW